MQPVPPYTLTRRRMKNMRMRVTPGTGELRVSAPLRMPQRTIDAWVLRQADWIERHRAAALERPEPLAPGPEADRLRAEVRPAIERLMDHWVSRMGVPRPVWKTRIMRTRWGSCNAATASITLNLDLARRPERLLEYVVVHELAHLREAHHGPAFVALMDAHLPDWRVRRAELNGR